MKNSILYLFLIAGVFAAQVNANLCKDGKDLNISKESRSEVNDYEAKFPDPNFHGNRTWNEVIVECNRKRDTNGDKVSKILNQSDFSSIKSVLTRSNLDEQIVRGEYDFFGLLATQQEYRYILSRKSGVWNLVLPYEAIINDVVKNRIDFYMGSLDANKRTHTKTENLMGNVRLAQWQATTYMSPTR